MKERNLIAATQMVAFVMQRDGDAVALCEAVRFGLHDLTAGLLSEGVHPDIRVTNEMTPLMFCGNRAIGELLVKAGADVNVEDSNGRTPLIWFTLGLQRKQSGIAYLKWIVRSGADVSRVSTLGESPIELAMSKYGIDIQLIS